MLYDYTLKVLTPLMAEDSELAGAEDHLSFSAVFTLAASSSVFTRVACSSVACPFAAWSSAISNILAVSALPSPAVSEAEDSETAEAEDNLPWRCYLCNRRRPCFGCTGI